MSRISPVRFTVMRAVIGIGALFVSPTGLPAAGRQGVPQCQPAGPLVRAPGLHEASGLALSRRTPGRLWTHNDSGRPVIFALDTRGAVTGSIEISGAAVADWEAIAVGPCGGSSCLYIGDIGDNNSRRKRITIYRVPEPDAASGSVKVADVLHATYPDGPHNAETLLVGGDGRLHIVTKEETGAARIYRFPSALKPGSTIELERVGLPSSQPGDRARITDGAVSPDGQWAVLRTRSSLTFYRASDLLAGQWRAASRVDLAPLKEPQGEGVALGNDATVFLAGEGGGKGQAGTFASFACAPMS